MSEFEKDIFTVLNYQGSKKNLLEFIFKNISNYIDNNKAVLDIFCGTASVAYGLKRYNTVYANDSELYASVIAKALLQYNHIDQWNIAQEEFNKYFNTNHEYLQSIFFTYVENEKEALQKLDFEMLQKLYNNFPTIWSGQQFNYYQNMINSTSDLRKYKNEIPYMLFTTYYSTTYFGLQQCFEIDSIRYAIEKIACKSLKNMLLSSLYFAMKECVFSKDGHMAQPLDISTNKAKLMKVRQKSILNIFISKIKEFNSESFVMTNRENQVFNLSMQEIIKLDDIKNNVGFIYADPPYTDMQYSRYYHLLNTVTLYDYDDISLNNGKLSKGLYRENRFQSPLSQKSQAHKHTEVLFKYCKENSINLGFSFAYPRDPESQPVNRYTMSIDSIIKTAEQTFGCRNVDILTEEYEHSNNRNANTKKVLEYLIICKSK
ncbi:DNA adenine methylase [Clostridium butyricum]|uniref:DNA adenine methylase n=1 Tax=Clostridium butyricum TaxID=1492 RepID=UPI001890D09F|nr:DNA adenine methylase [Clostridium butyricum]